jgi:phage-related protein
MPYATIKDESLIYDRSRNFSGIAVFDEINEISCPSNGSSVTFQSKDNSITTSDNYVNIIPVGINNLYASYNMRYEVDEEDAAKIANFIESKGGNEPIFFDTDPTLYKKINGFCTEYSLNQVDVKTFDLNAVFEITESPGHFNWTGLNFLYTKEIVKNYETLNNLYKKNDVAYDYRLEFDYQDRINNYYYCTEDHDSSQDASPNLEESNYWTRDFFWEPDVGQSSTVKMDLARFGDNGGFPLRRKIKKNIASFPINYRFSNITTQQLQGMLHFLESHAGYRRFKHKIGAVYNRPKVYICRTWTHTWVSFNSHDLELTLEEDPLGVIQKRPKNTTETLGTRVFDDLNEIKAGVETDVPIGWQKDQEDIFDLRVGYACRRIGEEAFWGCINLQGQLRIAGSVIDVDASAFRECISFSTLLIGGGVENIREFAFFGCVGLTGELLIPNSVDIIDDSAFRGCNGFDSLVISKNLSSIGEDTFRGCSNILSVPEMPETLEIISARSFLNCERMRGNLTIPQGTLEIREEAFKGCSKMGTKVILGDTIILLGDNAFNGCARVYHVYIYSIEAPLVASGEDPFANMAKLRKIHVPRKGKFYNTPFWNALNSAGKLEFDL